MSLVEVFYLYFLKSLAVLTAVFWCFEPRYIFVSIYVKIRSWFKSTEHINNEGVIRKERKANIKTNYGNMAKMRNTVIFKTFAQGSLLMLPLMLLHNMYTMFSTP